MYQTINKDYSFELVEKKSRFIANLVNVENKEDAEVKIKELKKKYHDARHNCFAFRVLDENKIYEKSSDDGEPSGTAGAPMLNILKKSNLCNVLIIVTRYFGGILLGTGGLVRAYSGACSGVIEIANKISIELGCEFKVTIEYSDFQNFQYYCKKMNIKIVNTYYGESVECNVEMKNEIKDKFLEDLQNKEINILSFEEYESKYIQI